MRTNSEAKWSYLIVGIGAIAGLMAAILTRKESREALIERSGRSLDFLNRQAAKLRETADVLVQQGKKLLACKGSNSVVRTTDAEKQAYQEDRRENLGG
jgi:ketopantoate reductase